MEAASHCNEPSLFARSGSGFLVPHEAAIFTRLSLRTLERHRLSGTGPVFIRLGRRVLYHPDDLMAWAQLHRYRSTSEPPVTATHVTSNSLRRA